MILPLRLSWDKASDRWSTILSPVINSPIATPVILQNIQLKAGANVINHTLGKNLTGWIPIRIRSSATFFDTQDANQTPQLTLQLTSTASCKIDILVF